MDAINRLPPKFQSWPQLPDHNGYTQDITLTCPDPYRYLPTAYTLSGSTCTILPGTTGTAAVSSIAAAMVWR